MIQSLIHRQNVLKKEALERAGHQCQGSDKHPLCRAKDGQAHPETDKPVILRLIRTIPGDESAASVRVLCERCFLEFNFTAHQTADWRTERAAMKNMEMFPIPERGW